MQKTPLGSRGMLIRVIGQNIYALTTLVPARPASTALLQQWGSLLLEI